MKEQLNLLLMHSQLATHLLSRSYYRFIFNGDEVPVLIVYALAARHPSAPPQLLQIYFKGDELPVLIVYALAARHPSALPQ